MKILLVAPVHPDLPSIDAEFAAISRHHDVRRVVRDADILIALENDTYDCLWFATHGGPEGILLSASTLTPEGVGQYVSSSGAKLCVLNTCASESIALRIIAGGDADLIFTITEKIFDEDALRFGSLLVAELAKPQSHEEAFNAAAGPGQTKYRYLRAKAALRGLALEAVRTAEKMRDQIDDLRDGQYKLSVDLAALTVRFEQQVQQGLLTQQQTMRQNGNLQPFFTPVFWVLLVLAVIILLALVVLIGRGNLSVG